MTPRPDRRSGQRHAGWGACAALCVAVGIGLLSELSTPRDVSVLGLLAAVPFLAAALSSVLWTVSAGAAAVGIAVAAADYAHALGARDVRVVIVGVAAGTMIAVGIAAVRSRRLRQLQHTQAIADVVQRTLLRPVPRAVAGTAVAAKYSSATRGADVGGDVYEVLETPFGVRVFVGDVRGKGLPAVRLAGAALGAFREWCYEEPTPPGLARRLDSSIARSADLEEFVTGVLLQVNGGEVELVNCGHPPPLLLHDGAVTALEPAEPSLPFGLGVTATVRRVSLAPGDRLLLYTDGASDARRRGRFFDVSGEFSRLGQREADEIVRRLHRRLVRFTRRRLADDVAIVLLERPTEPDLGTPPATVAEQHEQASVAPDHPAAEARVDG